MYYGYIRISTPYQSMDRQERAIKSAYPSAVIVREIMTGTVIQRKNLDRLLETIKANDTIVFDSVSRMSRNANEGYELYQRLYNEGVNLVFIKEPHINTDTYKKALTASVPLTGTTVDILLSGVNAYLMELAREQIRLAFVISQKEVDDLRQRTREGIVTARINGKQIGARPGVKLHIKKAAPAKEIILHHSISFGGSLNDSECAQLAGICRNTFYKYKREVLASLTGGNEHE